MHFSKVFAVVSLSVVATALPNTPPQQKTNCPSETHKLYCCKSTEVFDLSDPKNRDRANSLLNQPTGDSGSLVGGVPVLNNILSGVAQTVQADVPVKVPIGLGCTLDFTNCESPACCIMGSTTTTDTSSNSGLLSGTLKNGVNIPNLQFCQLL